MKILVVDQDEKDRNNLTGLLKTFEPDAIVEGAAYFDDAFEVMNNRIFDLVFINPDYEDTMTPADFALKLREKSKDTHIIFTSTTNEFMPEAFSVHADAYLTKPVTLDDVKRETDYLMNNYPAPMRPLEVVVRTFGGFNVYYRGRRLLFKRNKSKELLAILIDNRGLGLTTREACAMLFNGRPYDEITLGYFHVVLTSLKFTLEEYGIRRLIRKSVNYIAINPDMVDCDMYRYLRGDPDAQNDYHGDYMTGYSWSEYSPVKPNDEKKEAVNAG
ncbi:MAG: response regulator [Synergistaceae bacterium]|nr:response regulator [Synergistaceae bacterium]MBQ7666243.1 response regulator [Synergistaceae bacterium]